MLEHKDANQLLRQARRALDAGDRLAARRLAQQAVVQAPDQENPWLFLAAVSDPRAGLRYVDRALKINPQSRTAVKARLWLLQQIQKQKQVPQPPSGSLKLNQTSGGGFSTSRPAGMDRVPSAAVHPELGTAARPQKAAAAVDFTDPESYSLPLEAVSSRRLFSLSSVLMILFISIGLVAWVRLTPDEVYQRAAAAPMAKASFTPTATNTATPTRTYTPTPTFTPSPTPTLTPTASPTWYTNERRPFVTDLSELSHVDRWVDVDLGDQTLTAYEGAEPVETFLISSGLPVHPTVDGLFVIWRKYVSTDMSGPGYYLPDVPYTMYFYKGYGLHGTYWHDNFGNPMSHGCVNMRTEEAKWLYEFTEIGTLVNIHP
ncbi:MAG: L,D-transpeptidase family protein [Anaerolineales bacterium]|nr:L,D-transpeptidase family protein [Anaerolineales bacterium]